MTNAPPSDQPLETLRETIKDVRMAMLSTLRDGRIVTRPMWTQEMGPTGTLWFLTGVASSKVAEIGQNPSVGLAFSDSGSESYVSVSGTATITNDRALIAKFWNPFYKAWFEGPDDPSIRVVEIAPTAAEYWITKGGKIMSLASILVSAVTGKTLEAGENEEVRF